MLDTTSLDTAIKDRVTSWLEGHYDEVTKEAIRKLSEEEIIDAFYKELEFGTGGLRGIMGVGTNRINRYTIGSATQGLANYLKKSFANQTQISVAIAYDSRNNSPEFASIVADVFSANGVKVYLFECLRPTPELSFAVRHLGCKAGVVLTASHNPKEYNGYKAYWEDGGQVTPPHDKNIISEVSAITDIAAIKFERNTSLVESIGEEIDEAYLQVLEKLALDKALIERQKDLCVVYSPLHGTGVTLVPKILKRLGFENVHVVEEQAVPDGNFSTVVYPNPEESEAMTLALKKAKEVSADVVMATDPDADRVGIAVRDANGEYILLNGNQTFVLLALNTLDAWKSAGKITGNQMLVKTIVTTELAREIAHAYGVACYDTLTGFKYIAALIKEKEGKEEFIMGGEESYGYLIGDQVRDKDGVASCASIVQLAAYAKDKGVSLYDLLIETYIKYGFYLEELHSLTKKGKEGASEIESMMEGFRVHPPKQLAGLKLLEVYDYLTQSVLDVQTQNKAQMKDEFPKSNVLVFYLEDGSKISMRPSGTEPKIKFYFSVKSNLSVASDFERVKEELEDKIKALRQDLGI